MNVINISNTFNFKLLVILIMPILSFSQKIEFYNYGYEGIEKIYRKNDSTILFSNSRARPYIKDVIIDTLIKRYRKEKIKSGEAVIQISNAKVYAVIEIKKSNSKVKSVNIIYQKVEYKNGLIEIYKKPK
jgi:hypothetical protein